ncbi:hypothetical protein C2G38_2039976 [Gigaspora rosea]|uniref:Uncharacterized protein n=1 Tax=Gigaspora rosea TaxID=44941 RepID=A0A397UZW3_9GLOM|nr:hypothetical protein C2G38_2039976 [Gigaspora rosea]
MYSYLNVDLNPSQACCSFSECSNTVGSVELNLPLTCQQPSVILDSFEVNDPFNSFEEIGKKLDKYAMEHEFAVKKGCTHTCEDGSVWNATWTLILKTMYQDIID